MEKETRINKKHLSVADLADATGITRQRMYTAVSKEEPTNLTPSERKRCVLEIKKAMETNINFFDYE